MREFVHDALPIQEEALKANREFNPPDELASDWNRFLDLAEKDLSATQDLNEALDEGDGQRAQDAIAEVGSLNQQEITAARALDLTGCIKPKF